jgi:hypothetical protein
MTQTHNDAAYLEDLNVGVKPLRWVQEDVGFWSGYADAAKLEDRAVKVALVIMETVDEDFSLTPRLGLGEPTHHGSLEDGQRAANDLWAVFITSQLVERVSADPHMAEAELLLKVWDGAAGELPGMKAALTGWTKVIAGWKSPTGFVYALRPSRSRKFGPRVSHRTLTHEPTECFGSVVHVYYFEG